MITNIYMTHTMCRCSSRCFLCFHAHSSPVVGGLVSLFHFVDVKQGHTASKGGTQDATTSGLTQSPPSSPLLPYTPGQWFSSVCSLLLSRIKTASQFLYYFFFFNWVEKSQVGFRKQSEQEPSVERLVWQPDNVNVLNATELHTQKKKINVTDTFYIHFLKIFLKILL